MSGRIATTPPRATRQVAIDAPAARAHFRVRQHAVQVRSRDHAQWPVALRRIVEMHAQGDHPRQRGRRCVRVRHPLLLGPGTPARGGDASLDRQRGVLVPGHQPVGVGRLVEQGGAKWMRLTTEEGSRDDEKARVLGQVTNWWQAHQVSRASARTFQRGRFQRGSERRDLRQREYVGMYREPRAHRRGTNQFVISVSSMKRVSMSFVMSA